MFDDLFRMLIEVSDERKAEIIKVCQENPWLKEFGVNWHEDPFMDMDNKFTFRRCGSLLELARAFVHGNWALRTCFLFGNLAFVQQVNGGDEWFLVKENYGFESINFGRIIEKSGQREFEDLVGRLLKATKEQCLTLEY